MTNTTYKELADRVFNKIKDHSFLQMNETMAYQIVIGYLPNAIVRFQNCKQDLSDRDDELGEFNFKLTDDTSALLCNYMVLEWLESNYILTAQALKTRLTPADFKSLNLTQHLDKVIMLKNTLKEENDQLARNKSYLQSKLFDIVVGRKRV